MKATIVHDERGRIIAISKAVDLRQVGSKFTHVGMVPGSGQAKIEIELSAEQESASLADLHKEYLVDRATSRLVRKDHHNF
jgi:hypothetical protein